MEAETESFREAGNLNILAGFETPQLLLILNSHLICQGSLTGNDWIRTSQVTYAHTTGRRNFHVESPGPDSDISCRRLCGQQWRVRLSSCCRLDRIWEESRCSHGPRESRMLVFQSTSPPPPLQWGLWWILQNSLVSALSLLRLHGETYRNCVAIYSPEAWYKLGQWTSLHKPWLWDAFWSNMALCSLRVSPDIPSAAWLSLNSNTAHYFIRGVKYELFIKTHIIGCLTTV